MKTILFAVAFDLARERGSVIVGPGTKKACDKAIELYWQYSSSPSPCTIVVAAGKASDEFDGVIMSQIMKNYLVEHVPAAAVVALQGDTFNTDGEVRALARYMHSEAFRLIVCVKYWHAERTLRLIKWRFRQIGLQLAQIQIAGHELKISKKELLKEKMKTFLTLPWLIKESILAGLGLKKNWVETQSP